MEVRRDRDAQPPTIVPRGLRSTGLEIRLRRVETRRPRINLEHYHRS